MHFLFFRKKQVSHEWLLWSANTMQCQFLSKKEVRRSMSSCILALVRYIRNIINIRAKDKIVYRKVDKILYASYTLFSSTSYCHVLLIVTSQFGWIVKVKALCDSSNLCYVAAKKFIVINPDNSNGENIRQWMEADKNNKSVKKYFFLRPIACNSFWH